MTAPTPHALLGLGSWTCPSGNAVEVFVRWERAGLEHLEFEWTTPPPLSAADEAYYLGTILPAVHQRLAERQERPVGRALVIRSEPDG